MQDLLSPETGTSLPYLEHFPEPGGVAHRILVDHLPFALGRSLTSHYVIYSRQVSKEHAEIFRVGEEFRIRDLRSTNGTFVNGQRIVEAPLCNGDIVHVAHKEFRFSYEPPGPALDPGNPITEFVGNHSPVSVIRGSRHLLDLLKRHRVSIVFQPIVCLQTREPIGYEALGRGAHDQLSPDPTDLFRLADQCRLAPELSRVFRQAAIAEVAHRPGTPQVFFNLHPSEMRDEALLHALAQVAALGDGRRLVVIEVHEDVVADTSTLRWLRQQLNALGIGLAFDDFGSGQARLAELAEAPPDFIKLDRRLIRDIDRDKARQDLVQALNRVSADLGVQLIAEGIETREEAATCLELGCHFGQGFLFGPPHPVSPRGPKALPDTRLVDLGQLKQRLKQSRP